MLKPVIRSTRKAIFVASPHAWAALCCATLLAQALAASSGATISFSAFLALNGLGIGCAACVALRAHGARISIASLIGWAVVLRACALFMAPFFEDDYFRFCGTGI